MRGFMLGGFLTDGSNKPSTTIMSAWNTDRILLNAKPKASL